MKRVTAFILILLLIAPFSVSYIWLQYQKKLIKKEVKWKMIEGIDKSELIKLTFLKTDISQQVKWKHAKEFEYKHQMYDIVSTETNGDSITYFCWWDHDETQLNQQLKQLISNTVNKDNRNKDMQNRLLDLFKCIYTHKYNYFYLPQKSISTIQYIVFTNKISSQFENNTPFPPPEIHL